MTDNKQYIGKSVNAIVIRDGKVLLAWRESGRRIQTMGRVLVYIL